MAAMQSSSSSFLFFLLLFSSLLFQGSSSGDDSSSLQDKCAPEVPKVMTCLSYASAKSDTPSGECCTSVKDIRGRDPACLCYIIQQTSKGGSSVQSLGLQISRLIQLPSACNLANSSITDCPKLLNLSPSSPDNAIFSNNTKGAATSPSIGSANADTKSGGVMHQIQLGCTFAITVISAIFISLYVEG